MRLVDDVSDNPESSGAASQPDSLSKNKTAQFGREAAGSPSVAPTPASIAQKRAGLARWRILLDGAVAGNTGAIRFCPRLPIPCAGTAFRRAIFTI